MLASLEARSCFRWNSIFNPAWSLAPLAKFKMKAKQKPDEQKMNFHWFKRKGTLILHQGCVSYNRSSCSAGSFAQKAYKWFYLLPSRTNWTRKAFLLHKAVILHTRTDGATRTDSATGTDCATRKLNLPQSKLAKDWSPPAGWIFFDENWQWEDPRPYRWRPLSRSGSSRISDCQPLMGTHISCPSLFLLLRIKVSTGKARGNFLISFIKSKDWRT